MRQPGLIHPPLKCLVLSAWIMILMAIPVSRALGLSQKTSLQEVSEGLTCQCGCGLTVANCNHPQCEFSVPVRDQIEKMIAQGRSREQIIEALRVKYGEKILSAPTTSGFNLLAWITPFGVIAIGGALLVMVFSRWTSGEPSLPARLDEQNFDAALRRRLDDEVRKDA